jgi:hypothetical protein
MWWGFVAWSVLVIVSVLDARFRLRVHGGFLVNFDEWESAIIRAYKDAPATYQTAYAAWLKSTLGTGLPKDHAGLFLAGWLAACDALANRLVGWLDEPAGDDVSAFLGFVEELRKGDLS